MSSLTSYCSTFSLAIQLDLIYWVQDEEETGQDEEETSRKEGGEGWSSPVLSQVNDADKSGLKSHTTTKNELLYIEKITIWQFTLYILKK